MLLLLVPPIKEANGGVLLMILPPLNLALMLVALMLVVWGTGLAWLLLQLEHLRLLLPSLTV